MKKLFKIKKNRGPARRQAGMTYVEIIVVLGIFAVMSSIIMFNYRIFQAKVDIKSLASDIALKIVEAQKSSLSGKLPTTAQPPTWKPSYGVYFTSGSTTSFTYFADTSGNGMYDPGPNLDLDLDHPSSSKNDQISVSGACPHGHRGHEQ